MSVWWQAFTNKPSHSLLGSVISYANREEKEIYKWEEHRAF